MGYRSIASCCNCNFCGCHWSSASRNATNSVFATFHAALRVPPGPTFDGMSSTRIGIAEVAAYSLASCNVLSVLISLATIISAGCSVCCATLCRVRSRVCAALCAGMTTVIDAFVTKANQTNSNNPALCRAPCLGCRRPTCRCASASCGRFLAC